MFRWYAINTYSGQENKVKADIWRRVESLNATDYLRDIVVPTEKVYEGEGDQRKQVDRRTMPGYVLLNLDLNETSWSVIRYTPGVMGFVGSSDQPDPLSKLEVDRIFGKQEEPTHNPADASYAVGDQVEITDGPLKGFQGDISDVDPASGKAKVLVTIFGRETPAELKFSQMQSV